MTTLLFPPWEYGIFVWGASPMPLLSLIYLIVLKLIITNKNLSPLKMVPIPLCSIYFIFVLGRSDIQSSFYGIHLYFSSYNIITNSITATIAAAAPTITLEILLPTLFLFFLLIYISSGTRIKTRKRNIPAPLDPAAFSDAVVQIYLDNAGDLVIFFFFFSCILWTVNVHVSSVASPIVYVRNLIFYLQELIVKSVESSELNFSRYGDTFFEACFLPFRYFFISSRKKSKKSIIYHFHWILIMIPREFFFLIGDT